jgi:hypothetical protein
MVYFSSLPYQQTYGSWRVEEKKEFGRVVF